MGLTIGLGGVAIALESAGFIAGKIGMNGDTNASDRDAGAAGLVGTRMLVPSVGRNIDVAPGVAPSPPAESIRGTEPLAFSMTLPAAESVRLAEAVPLELI